MNIRGKLIRQWSLTEHRLCMSLCVGISPSLNGVISENGSLVIINIFEQVSLDGKESLLFHTGTSSKHLPGHYIYKVAYPIFSVILHSLLCFYCLHSICLKFCICIVSLLIIYLPDQNISSMNLGMIFVMIFVFFIIVYLVLRIVPVTWLEL